ncbi:hypothetical protein ACFYW9_10410 [Streptomyces sp. NPDC002698]|uniref:hypothetical protein n=1 Tax=Streptomyces sp. NPDC002698 TaxID=3364660 RepID=UPI00367EAD54
MTAAHPWRSASQGLLKRRRSASDPDGCYARRTPPSRPVDGAPWFPEAALPPGLLPLPSGFDLRGA